MPRLLLPALLLMVCSAFAQMVPMPGMDQPSSKPQPQCMPGMDMPGCPSTGAPTQQGGDTSNGNMPGMQMGSAGMRMMQQMHPHTFVEEIQHHATSGTSAEPNSTPVPMLMSMPGKWMLMLHGAGFISDIQQSSARGGDKLFSTNWVMPMSQRELGPGQLTLRAMFSLEPATVTNRRYPLLFQQGETAYGKAIADGQHPHDFFMELAALYDLHVGEHSLISFYAAPIGDPALGPTAYPHRASAGENPVGTLGHHQEDSTHIAADVVTVGVTHRTFRLEAGGFHGREPDENRWDIDQGRIDSWSTRLTLQPSQNWSGQYSFGRIHSPEALAADENQDRMTASVMYNRPIGDNSKPHGNWANSVIWGRTKASDGGVENSHLLESTLRIAKNSLWTRIENAGRTNELLLGERALPAGFSEKPLSHVQAYTFGYGREIAANLPHVSVAFGGQISAYGVGKPLRPIYGDHPVGGVIFLRLRLQ